MNVKSSLTDHYAICHLYAMAFYSFIYCHIVKGLFLTDDVDFNNVSVLALTFTRVVSLLMPFKQLVLLLENSLTY